MEFALEDEEETLQKCNWMGARYKPLIWMVFDSILQNEQKESFHKQETDLHFYSSNDIDMLLANEDESHEDKLQETPVKQSTRSSWQSTPDLVSPLAGTKTPASNGKFSTGNQKSSFMSSSPVTPFGHRSNKYVLQYVFNKHIMDSIVDERTEPISEDDVIRRLPPVYRCSLEILGLWPSPGCRYMYDSIEDKFDSLERRIKRFATALAAKEACNVFNHVALASQESVFVVGLVCCDGEGHLNDKSILLEGSVEYSGGQRVRLDLHKLVQFSFFPGQVIGVEGHNPSGHCLVASRVVDSFPLLNPLEIHDQDAPSAKRLALDQTSEKVSLPITPKAISVVIAAGPFTTADNLAFEPLADLLVYAQKKRPNLIILLGPFVDSEHSQIRTGTVDRFFGQIFQEEVCARLRDYCEEVGSGARVVLVPSTRDAHHDFVFPQPPFDINDLEDLNPQITCIANPGIFRLNEVTIGCCTVDILRHLSSEEISRIPEGSPNDRLARLATHVLSQRSFYPLFPAGSGLPLDLSIAPEALHIHCIPDIFILPSDLAPFVKVLPPDYAAKQTGTDSLQKGSSGCGQKCSKSICINPGRLAKGINGGTFAELFTLGKQNSALEDTAHCLENRTKVSIVRI